MSERPSPFCPDYCEFGKVGMDCRKRLPECHHLSDQVIDIVVFERNPKTGEVKPIHVVGENTLYDEYYQEGVGGSFRKDNPNISLDGVIFKNDQR